MPDKNTIKDSMVDAVMSNAHYSVLPQNKDYEFLKEMKQRLLDYRESGDHEQLDFVEQMINDWIDELQE